MEIRFKLLVNTEKLIAYMNRQLPNFPKKELVLKNNIEKNQYELIENVFGYNIQQSTRIKEKYLKDYLEFYNISQSEFASRLGITQKHMNEILNGKSDITLEMAVNIEILTKIPISFIINSEHRKKVQKQLMDKYKSEKNIDKKMKEEFSLKELNDRKWVDFKDISNPIQNYMDIMEFLKVKDLTALSKIQEKTLFKKNGNDLNKLNLWIARCDEIAKNQSINKYDSINFLLLISDIKEMSFKKGINIEELQKLLNSYGIYFVVEKALSGTKIRGCFKVKGKNPAIYITKNYIGKDSFYYELYHELGHCKSDYNEAKSKVIVEGNENQEKRADEFALNTMIDKDVWKKIENNIKENELVKISEDYKIPMSFIVGRLAKFNKINYSSKLYNKYKRD